MRTISLPAGPFTATCSPPGDKSLSHRAHVFAAMAPGRSQVLGAGTGADVASTVELVRRLGVVVESDGTVMSPGVEGWRPADGDLDCGNSGTTLRLMAGALAGRPFASVLTGDDSLQRRPMRRLVDPLGALGAEVAVTGPGGTPPVTVQAPQPLAGAEVTVPIASAQVRSAVQLAALQAEGESIVDSPGGFRDHTERWLETWGLGERIPSVRDGRLTAFRIWPGPVPTHRYLVPGDPSSAAYLWALAAVRPGATVTTPGVSLNAGRIGFLEILDRFGAEIHAEVTGAILGDPIGTVTVRGKGLFGTEVGAELAVAALDELPLVAVVGALAEGITTVRDAAELRGKESDRIETTVAMIRALGGGAEATDDGFVVVGTGFLDPGVVEVRGDHRIAMAATVAAAGVTGDVAIDEPEAVAVSWPGFFEQVDALWSTR
jgi:3-phosphoshikimate 1-carboxyvinyltransferase